MPSERLAAQFSVPLPSNNIRRDAMFYEEKHKNLAIRNPPNHLQHTATSSANKWGQLQRKNDLWLSHDHPPNAGGGTSLWNSPTRYSGRSRKSPKESTLRAPAKLSAEITSPRRASARAAQSIIEERTARHGLLGRTIPIQFHII